MNFLSLLNPIGAGLSAVSGAKAKNRGTKLEAQFDLDRLLSEREDQLQNMQIGREQEGRAGMSDAWRKLLSSQRLLEPGMRPQLSPYSIAPRQPNMAEQVGANYMGGEALRRIQNGNPIPQVTQHQLEVDRKLFNPSKSEQWTGWLGALFGAAPK